MKTTQQLAGYKAAHTRKCKSLDALVSEGKMKVTVAAGYKAASKRRLNEIVS